MADVFACVAADTPSDSGSTSNPFQQPKDWDIDLEGRDVSEEWRQRWARLVLTYQGVSSR